MSDQKAETLFEYPPVELDDGTTWHIYRHHTQAGVSWIISCGSGGGEGRTISTKEVAAHLERAKATFDDRR